MNNWTDCWCDNVRAPISPMPRTTPQLNSKINLPCVNQSNGTVTNSFKMFSPWKAEYTMEKLLIGLKNEMIANKKAAQPADGDMF